MSDTTIITKRLTLLRAFVAQSRGHACRFVCYESDGDLKGTIGLQVRSAASSLWIAADGLDDTIEVAATPPPLAEDGLVEAVARGHWADLEGRSILSAWLMTNQQGYTDGLQLALLGTDGGLVVAELLAIASRLSLTTSSVPAMRPGSSFFSGPGAAYVGHGDELTQRLAILDEAIECCTSLSDVRFLRVRSVIEGVVLVFGERALSVRIEESVAQVELLDAIPRDGESVAGDEAWRGLLGARLMWLWSLTDVSGRAAGIQAEFWKNEARAGTLQVLVFDEGLRILELR